MPRVNANADYGLWVMVMCQWGSSIVTTTLVEDVDKGDSAGIRTEGI